jgi:6-phosphogluconate dehydrogenase
MSTKNADIGLVGLAVMGQNLALNIADHGYTIAVYNRDSKKMVNFIEECKKNEPSAERVIGHADLASFVLSINAHVKSSYWLKPVAQRT